jgi:murein L,D-transpeptidase YafK
MQKSISFVLKVSAILIVIFLVLGILSNFDAALPPGVTADRVVIEKQAGRLTLFKNGKALKSYTVALGWSPGKKERQGDRRTPEGRYKIIGRHAESRYYLALRLSYPNASDNRRAREQGRSPGGDIMIHGLPPAWSWVGRWHSLINWTQGCIAITNPQMDELWRAVPLGTEVVILS